MKDEKVIALMAERDKMRAKIIALSKNKDNRSKYNSLIMHTKAYEDITNKLVSLGRKLTIKTDILKHEYWREQYRLFNENNPNIIMPRNTESRFMWDITVDGQTIITYVGTEHEFKIFYKGVKAAYSVKNKFNDYSSLTYKSGKKIEK
jgi:glutamine synthetase